MKEKNCNSNRVEQGSPVSQSLSGANSQLLTMQDQSAIAGGKSCQRKKELGTNLLETCETREVTASKYNGGANDIVNKYLVGMDYLQLNLKGRIPIELDEEEVSHDKFRFVNKSTPTKHFQTMYNLYDQNQLIGIVIAYPRPGSVLDLNTLQLKVDNQNFYSDIDLGGILQKFFSDYDVKFNNITRLDLFIDSFGMDACDINEFEQLLSSGKIISDTRVRDIGKHLNQVNGRYKTNGITWGKRNSERYLRIYNKSIELQHGNKDYISDFHLKNGLVERDVIRFEYELKSSFFNKVVGFEWYEIFDKKVQLKLVEVARRNHFSFVYEDGQTRNDRKVTFEPFNWDKIFSDIKKPYVYSNLRKRDQGHSTRSVKVGIGYLIGEYVNNHQNDEILKIILFLVDRHDLRKWFKNNLDAKIKTHLKNRFYYYEFDYKKFSKSLLF